MKFSSAIALAGAAQTLAAVRPRPMVSSGAIQDQITSEKYVWFWRLKRKFINK